MADFTINSLPTGTLSDTDTFVKSDSNGALTKITGSGLKTAIVGNANISDVGDSVTSAIRKIAVGTAYTPITTEYFNSAPYVKKAGKTAYLEIAGLTLNTAVSASRTKVATIPEGYRPAIEQSFVCMVVSNGASCPCNGVISASGSVMISPGPLNSGSIPANSVIYAQVTYFTKD